MKFLIFLGILCVSGVFGKPSETRLEKANVDKYIDVLFQYVDKWIIKNGLDPLKVPDIVKSFRVKPALITYSGELKLTNGHMQGLSKVKRGGNSEMSYEAMYLNMKIPIQVEDAQVDYDYKATLLDLLTHSGGVDAHIKDLILFLDVTVDTKTLEIILQDFHIINSGTITIKFSGNPALDWLANFLSEFITLIIHDVVQNAIEGEVKGIIEKEIKAINDKRPPHGDSAHPLIQKPVRNQAWYNDFMRKPKSKNLDAVKILFPYPGHENVGLEFY